MIKLIAPYEKKKNLYQIILIITALNLSVFFHNKNIKLTSQKKWQKVSSRYFISLKIVKTMFCCVVYCGYKQTFEEIYIC